MGKTTRDRVVYAVGSIIYAHNKEGKTYFPFDSHIENGIQSVSIEENKIWTVGEYMVNYFEVENKEINDVHYY